MRRAAYSALIGVTLSLLAGCATPGIPYDRPAAKVETIGVVTPKFPDRPDVFLASNVGQSFGLIGALVEAGMQSEREAKFDAIVQEKKYQAREHFLTALTESLRAEGYTVTRIEVDRKDTEFTAKYPTETGPKVDAYLDVVTLNFGYVAAGIRSSTPYRPMFAARTRLVSAKTAAILMQENIFYNPINPNAPNNKYAVTVPPDPEHQFTNFNALMGNPDGAVKGLMVAVERSAQTIGKLLH